MINSASPNGSGAPAAGTNGKVGPGTRGVLLLNLGTPDAPTPKAVRRYLAEFLSDPEVIKLPPKWRWATGLLGRFIALMRASRSAHAYQTIWNDRGSPLKYITEDQAEALESAMPRGWRVFYAMRYGNPTVDSVLDQIIAEGINDVVVIPMYPQFSGPTTKTAIEDLYRALQTRGQQLHVTIRNTWYDDAGYIDAQAKLLEEVIRRENLSPHNCHLLFSTHSMPKSYIEAGDPYQDHVLRTVELVIERLGWPADRMGVSYQSKLGPVPWLEPGTEQTLRDLGEAGEENVLVCPVSFTVDCLETIEELGVTYREVYEASGGKLHLCQSMNTFDPFIKCLTTLALKGPRPVNEKKRPQQALMSFAAPREERDVRSLVMIGVSLKGRLNGNGGPAVEYVEPQQFQKVKKPQGEVTEVLQQIRDSGDFVECWLWNTCSRFELYGWLKEDPESPAANEACERTRRLLLGDHDDIPTNVLRGQTAWHHLLRTCTGLNSGLPGDLEVIEQMKAAHRIANRCDTAGDLTDNVATEAERALSWLHDETGWARFRREYCPVAMQRIAVVSGCDWSTANCVVIGGSATARSVLQALKDRYGTPAAGVTLAYRKHSKGQQLKRLHEALGDGHQLAVDEYSDPKVMEAILKADIVVFASDSRTPALDAADITGQRDFKARPLTVLDFNTFGSTLGLDVVDGVTLHNAETLENEVANFAYGLCECPAFGATKQAVENEIHRIVSRVDCQGSSCCKGGPGDCGNCCGNGHPHHNEHPHDKHHGHTNGKAENSICPCGDGDDAPARCPKRLLAERIES